jgi:Ca2+:H+ antiporter
MRHWPIAAPLVAIALLGVGALLPPYTALSLAMGAALVGAVLAAVHHAEVVAQKLGEPLGTLVLALAVTVIEVALILSVMLSGGPGTAALARDAIYAAVMIICNGVVGLCILVGGLRYREQAFRVEGAGPELAAIVALSTLSLVLPSFTTSAPGAVYTSSQLAFAGVSSLLLWGVFVFVQTVRHRDYFLPPLSASADEGAHLPPPSFAATVTSAALLLVSLIAVVGLAKSLSPAIEALVKAAGVPDSVVGIAIAMVVLLPETLAAVRAAAANRLQTSMNLALGSALASIGLTVPAIVAASLLFGLPVILGIDQKSLVLLSLTFVVGAITLATGRTSILQGAVHLVVFAAFLFLSLVP